MVEILTTESGELLTAEDVAGVTGASSLNDSRAKLIVKETFETNPALSGWTIGASWVWNSINGNMEPV